MITPSATADYHLVKHVANVSPRPIYGEIRHDFSHAATLAAGVTTTFFRFSLPTGYVGYVLDLGASGGSVELLQATTVLTSVAASHHTSGQQLAAGEEYSARLVNSSAGSADVAGFVAILVRPIG